MDVWAVAIRLDRSAATAAAAAVLAVDDDQRHRVNMNFIASIAAAMIIAIAKVLVQYRLCYYATYGTRSIAYKYAWCNITDIYHFDYNYLNYVLPT